MRSAVRGLSATAWSGLEAETSKLPMPSVSRRMRSPERPRNIGRDAVGPKLLASEGGVRRERNGKGEQRNRTHGNSCGAGWRCFRQNDTTSQMMRTSLVVP